jgi:hypothetical protein
LFQAAHLNFIKQNYPEAIRYYIKSFQVFKIISDTEFNTNEDIDEPFLLLYKTIIESFVKINKIEDAIIYVFDFLEYIKERGLSMFRNRSKKEPIFITTF